MARERLREARKAKGLTQAKTAEAVGIGLRYYQAIEAGKRTGGVELWDALEDLFGTNQRVLRRCDRAGSRS